MGIFGVGHAIWQICTAPEVAGIGQRLKGEQQIEGDERAPNGGLAQKARPASIRDRPSEWQRHGKPAPHQMQKRPDHHGHGQPEDDARPVDQHQPVRPHQGGPSLDHRVGSEKDKEKEQRQTDRHDPSEYIEARTGTPTCRPPDALYIRDEAKPSAERYPCGEPGNRRPADAAMNQQHGACCRQADGERNGERIGIGGQRGDRSNDQGKSGEAHAHRRVEPVENSGDGEKQTKKERGRQTGRRSVVKEQIGNRHQQDKDDSALLEP